MKKLFLLIILLIPNLSFGQEKPNAVLVDEFGKLCSEDIMARNDNFYIQVNANPKANGVILYYGDQDTVGGDIKLAGDPRIRPDILKK